MSVNLSVLLAVPCVCTVLHSKYLYYKISCTSHPMQLSLWPASLSFPSPQFNSPLGSNPFPAGAHPSPWFQHPLDGPNPPWNIFFSYSKYLKFVHNCTLFTIYESCNIFEIFWTQKTISSLQWTMIVLVLL